MASSRLPPRGATASSLPPMVSTQRDRTGVLKGSARAVVLIQQLPEKKRIHLALLPEETKVAQSTNSYKIKKKSKSFMC